MNSLINQAKKLFVDSLRLKVQGGKGGHGLPQFGGIGGNGGDVFVVGSKSAKSLGHIQRAAPIGSLKGGDGYPSRRTRLLGEAGKDLKIQVPLGITVTDSNKQFLGDINNYNDKILVAMGGRGGDKFNDNQGFVGQTKTIRLDLKMISDAVLVGFPNAGKSSLLRAISNARPKVADYPFTTLKPSLGVMEFDDYRRISVADLPGLVEGAHKNLGLGHEFLKHIERTRVLLFLIDINNIDLGPIYAKRTPLETLCILIKEIELYDDTILNKPAILAISKMDTLTDSEKEFESLKKEVEAMMKKQELLVEKIEENIRPSKMIKFDEILAISSNKSQNINQLKVTIREVIDKYAELERDDKAASSYAELQPLETNRILQ